MVMDYLILRAADVVFGRADPAPTVFSMGIAVVGDGFAVPHYMCPVSLTGNYGGVNTLHRLNHLILHGYKFVGGGYQVFVGGLRVHIVQCFAAIGGFFGAVGDF